MSKSTFRRLAVQIPIEEQPAFLAATFDAEVLKKALRVIEPDAIVDIESISQLAEKIGYEMHAEAPDPQEDNSHETGEKIAQAIRALYS